MKALVILFIIVLPGVVIAQEQGVGQETATQGKWKIGICFSPDYSYRRLTAEPGGTTLIKDHSDEREIAKVGFTTGVEVIYKISERISVASGVQYANRGYRSKGQRVVFEPDPLSWTPHTGEARYVRTFNYLDVPLCIEWRAYQHRKLALIARGGIIGSYFLGGVYKSYLKMDDGTSDNRVTKGKDPYKEFTFSPVVAVGAEYKLSNMAAIRAVPTVRYSITSMYDAPINEYLWSCGLSVGYCRTF